MIRKEELTYDSRDRKTKIHAIRWIPEEKPIAILQIVHGMQEYVDRYDEFARFMAEHGILVAGNDHQGHGGSVHEGDCYGYFGDKDPATVLVRDVHRLKKMTQQEYPGIPIILLGHSFGSFVVREYLTRYGTGIDAAIIQGTGMQSLGLVRFAKCLATVIQVFGGPRYRSKLINHIAFGKYLDKIPNAKTKDDWLSHNEISVDAYLKDPACNFIFTLNGFLTMGELVKRTQSADAMEDIPKNLPILLTSGAEDPVGDYGAAVRKLYEIYLNEHHLSKVDLKIYDGMRHEILQEVGRQQVFEDQYEWIRKVIS